MRTYRMTLRGAPTDLPDRFRIDGSLIGGSALFGLGWGLSGICPGPALLLLTGGTFQSIVFVAAVIAGFWLLELLPSARDAGQAFK